MGLMDRDYMHDRHRTGSGSPGRVVPPTGGRRPAATAERRPLGLGWMIVTWLVAGLLVYKLMGLLPLKDRHRRPPTATQQVVQKRAAGTESTLQSRHSEPLERVIPTGPSREPPVESTDRSAAGSIRKCVLDGKVTYSDQACAGELARSAQAPVPVSTSSPLVQPGTIYLCKAYSGGTFWAQAPCSHHNALIERIANVPTGMPFERQVQVASEQIRPLHQQAVNSSPLPEATSNVAECKALDAKVQALDAYARQPLPAFEQDRIRVDRRAARDRQFAIRC